MGDVATTIYIRRLVGIISALNVLSINQSLDSFLDHVNVRLESGRQLLDGFGHELLVGEVLPLSERTQKSVTAKQARGPVPLTS